MSRAASPEGSIKSEDSRSSNEDQDGASRQRPGTEQRVMQTLEDLFSKDSTASYYLSQKSEMLLFEPNKEQEDKAGETFVWRKKNQKIGLDKLDPQRLLVVNRLKQEETAVGY